MIHLKNDREIEIMDRANAIVHEVLDRLGSELAPGVSLLDLDRIAESTAAARGAACAFKGYHGYPASACLSLNDEVVHGIPNGRTLAPGDVLSIDFGVLYEGYYGDAARTFVVGEADEKAGKLLDVTRRGLMLGVEQARPGNRVSDIGHAVQTWVESNGFSVVRDFVGHGVGRALHEEPQIPNFGEPGRGPRLQPGMVIAIEPMVNEGTWEVTIDDDGWTVRTADQARSAHFEYSIAVTKNGPRILGVSSQ